jgi:hypothetical protein
LSIVPGPGAPDFHNGHNFKKDHHTKMFNNKIVCCDSPAFNQENNRLENFDVSSFLIFKDLGLYVGVKIQNQLKFKSVGRFEIGLPI